MNVFTVLKFMCHKHGKWQGAKPGRWITRSKPYARDKQQGVVKVSMGAKGVLFTILCMHKHEQIYVCKVCLCVYVCVRVCIYVYMCLCVFVETYGCHNYTFV